MSARPEDHVNQYSRPSELKITDVRAAIVGWEGWRFPLIRIDTNQGLSGYGEVRDGASKTYALMLKSRLLGENLHVDQVFARLSVLSTPQGGGGAASRALMILWARFMGSCYSCRR